MPKIRRCKLCRRSVADLVGTYSCLHSLPSNFPPLDEQILKTYENRNGKKIELKKGSQVCCDHLSSCVGKLKNHRLTRVAWRTLEQGAADRGGNRHRNAMVVKRKRLADELKKEEGRIREEIKRLKEDELQAERGFAARRQELKKRKDALKAQAQTLDIQRKFLPSLKNMRLYEHQQLEVDLRADNFYAS